MITTLWFGLMAVAVAILLWSRVCRWIAEQTGSVFLAALAFSSPVVFLLGCLALKTGLILGQGEEEGRLEESDPRKLPKVTFAICQTVGADFLI